MMMQIRGSVDMDKNEGVAENKEPRFQLLMYDLNDLIEMGLKYVCIVQYTKVCFIEEVQKAQV